MSNNEKMTAEDAALRIWGWCIAGTRGCPDKTIREKTEEIIIQQRQQAVEQARREANQWQPIETCPWHPFKSYWVMINRGDLREAYAITPDDQGNLFLFGDEEYFTDWLKEDFNYWMPIVLPKPPQKEGE